jgi:uncharacterized membrane protein YoaK (UPF0700 family)
MNNEERLVSERTRDLLVLALAFGSGCMDAFAILALGGVFISALTGNTVLLGISLVQGDYVRATASVLVFAAFIPGTLVGSKILRSASPGPHWSRQMTTAMALEAVLLFVLFLMLFLWGDRGDEVSRYLPILVGSFAMGLQFTNTGRLTIKGASVMIITGMLIRLFNGVVFHEGASGGGNGAKNVTPGNKRPLSENETRFLALIWVLFLIGATVAAALMLFVHLGPVLIVLGINLAILTYVGARSVAMGFCMRTALPALAASLRI